jgi:hypothetical protein
VNIKQRRNTKTNRGGEGKDEQNVKKIEGE